MGFRLICLCRGTGQIQANLKNSNYMNRHTCESDLQAMRSKNP